VRLLVMPDPHAHPDYDNDRFDWLARFILDKKPDVLLCIGDFADMPAFSSYDKGTRAAVGRTYEKDFAAAHEAQERLLGPVRSHLTKCSKSRRWDMRQVLTLGNHEDRIDRCLNLEPQMEGTISIDRLRYKSWGWEVIPYRRTVDIGGFICSHEFAGCCTIHGGKTILRNNLQSAICGHSHRLDIGSAHRPDGTPQWGVVCGYYGHAYYDEKWSTRSKHRWWHGVILMDGVKHGDFRRIQLVKMDALEEAAA